MQRHPVKLGGWRPSCCNPMTQMSLVKMAKQLCIYWRLLAVWLVASCCWKPKVRSTNWRCPLLASALHHCTWPAYLGITKWYAYWFRKQQMQTKPPRMVTLLCTLQLSTGSWKWFAYYLMLEQIKTLGFSIVSWVHSENCHWKLDPFRIPQ